MIELQKVLDEIAAWEARSVRDLPLIEHLRAWAEAQKAKYDAPKTSKAKH